MQAVRDLDPFHGLRKALGGLGKERSEWAGIPIPIDGERLVVEPNYPFADVFNELGAEEPEDPSYRVVNRWWSIKTRTLVSIVELDGRRIPVRQAMPHSFKPIMSCLGIADVWGIEQEANAIQLLAGMIRHQQFKKYLMTGMFLERSPRSGVTYVFRKLRPTIAISSNDAEQQATILACLCMHPIAYYQDTFAGAMCPTDDVIAHLTMMRADEHMYWKRCTQHHPSKPEAGLV